MAVDLLQAAGLNKYEAEAYAALLQEGPLTGYEVGKRSGVPLSRSYEVLERLVHKGLALVQPGDPPRYRAEDAEHLVTRMRAETTARLDALADGLRSLAPTTDSPGFWVVRGRENILARARAMIEAARGEVALHLPPGDAEDLDHLRALARARHASQVRDTTAGPDALLLVVDGREALAGTLQPPDRCQAVLSANPALVGSVLTALVTPTVTHAETTAPATGATAGDWVEWETRKQRRLWSLRSGDVA